MDFAGIVCFVRPVYAVEVQCGCVEERLGELAPDLGYFQKKRLSVVVCGMNSAQTRQQTIWQMQQCISEFLLILFE